MNHQTLALQPGLYLVATPIGTARDITLRALDILASADLLAAEDTRSLRRLMEIHGIPLGDRRVLAYHDHSGAGTRSRLLDAIAGGASVAYASEAGMPLIADPGYDLVRAVTQAGHAVTAAPGPSAVVTALALAGLPTDAFFFAGFLPSTASARRARLEALADIPGTLVVYEAPGRTAATLADMAAVLGADRPAALARELTKKFEEVRRGSLGDLAEGAAGRTLKGEVVLLVDRQRSQTVSDSQLVSDLTAALATMRVKDAADLVARSHNLPRRRVYQRALELGKDRDG